MKKLFNKLLTRPFIYIPNPGNAGDKLIAHGTYTIFRELGLEFSVGSFSDRFEGKLLVYGGGGNLVGDYFNCKNFLINNMDRNEIVILPHTIKDEDQLIKNLSSNVVVICRETSSFNYVQNNIQNPQNVYLAHDMAFCVNVPPQFKNKVGRGVLNAFRSDVEKTSIEIPIDNIDVSCWLDRVGLDEDTVEIISNDVFDFLANYRIVCTNRLHVAIASALINREVYFFPNSYYKNQSVYENSLKNYSNVTFIADNVLPKDALLDKKCTVSLQEYEVNMLKEAAILLKDKSPEMAYRLLFMASRARRGIVILELLRKLSDHNRSISKKRLIKTLFRN